MKRILKTHENTGTLMFMVRCLNKKFLHLFPGITSYMILGYSPVSKPSFPTCIWSNINSCWSICYGQLNQKWFNSHFFFASMDMFSWLSVEMKLRQLWAVEPGNLGSRPNCFSYQLYVTLGKLPWVTMDHSKSHNRWEYSTNKKHCYVKNLLFTS